MGTWGLLTMSSKTAIALCLAGSLPSAMGDDASRWTSRGPLVTAMVSCVVMWLLNFIAHFKTADPKNFKQEGPGETSVVVKADGENAAPEGVQVSVDPSQGFDAWANVARNQRESLPLAMVVMIFAVIC